MTNFAYIPSQWATFAATAIEAEANVYRAPMYSAMLCRKSLEEWVRWMYENDEDLVLPFDTNLNTLLHDKSFQDVIAPTQFKHINLIRKIGNNAVHTNAKIKATDVLHVLKLLHGFIGWVTKVYHVDAVTVPPFDESLIDTEAGTDKSKQELKKLEDIFLEQQTKLRKLEAELEVYKAIKDKNIASVPLPHDPDEAQTRKIYIDALLQEMGWDTEADRVVEFPVRGCVPQPDGSIGDGRVDYVLWGDDGLPLAVIEAKRTRRDYNVGKHQAKCYADCLEKEFGQRPVIFFTNGYKIWIWDDTYYVPRQVHGYYTKDELQSLIQRRQYRKPLANLPINNAITDRYYQHEAIRKVAEALEQNHRQVLLVMATGTGKTRVSASIIDFLSKAQWVKRVLFLADRNALIHQAKVNLNDYLPNLPAVDLTKEKEDESSRIVFSTYQTMINMIDGERDGDNRYYGVGHFDLIIFDEIHRSVYNRYRHILEYFDGIRLGLTATPRDEADKDTYGLFDLQAGNPTYAYELNQAVDDDFLRPPRAMAVPIKFQRQGIKYAELSEEDKLRYEAEFADPITGAFPDEINNAALNQWLFNVDTVDKVIGHLMENGIKVEGGDKLAKTIIFARSHNHAVFIEQRFNIQYPEYKGNFLAVIDYQEEKKYDLLNRFKDKDKLPQIAVSVDMLDTGIDVPEVCNLVFFRPIRSRTKYWQMIGRGTRLCPDLFGPGLHKEHFVIFDFCENFEYFNINPKGLEASSSKSLSQRLFELRLRLGHIMSQEDSEEFKTYGQSLISQLIAQTQALNTESFIVRQHWSMVEKYQDAPQWQMLSDLDIRNLQEHISPIVRETTEDEMAKRFDITMMDLQISIYQGTTRQVSIIDKVIETARKLSKKASIPMVAQKMELIKAISQKSYWEKISVLGVERIRSELRDLMKFIDAETQPIYYTKFTDEYAGDAYEVEILYSANDLKAYKRKVEQFFIENQHHLTIIKLRQNSPITDGEIDELEKMLFDQGTLGTKENFIQAYGEQPLGKIIRSLLGLDINAAKKAFGEILNAQNLNTQQIRFMDIIINHLAVNGTIAPEKLFEAPFTDISTDGIMGIFDGATSARIIDLIAEINHGAEVG